VVPVVVGVEDPANREGGDEPEVGQHFLGMPGVGTCVDQKNRLVPHHQADVLVEELVPAAKDTFA
jgi:hypothetical protein